MGLERGIVSRGEAKGDLYVGEGFVSGVAADVHFNPPTVPGTVYYIYTWYTFYYPFSVPYAQVKVKLKVNDSESLTNKVLVIYLIDFPRF